MTLTDQQRQEAILRLAGLKCPTCNGDTVVERIDSRTREPFEITCPDCQGTGARLPGLRRKCEGRWVSDMGTIAGEPGPRRFRPCSAPHYCPDCNGRSWNPVEWTNERELRLALPQIGLKPAYEPDSGMWLVRWLDGDGWLHSAPSPELIDAIPSTEIIDAIAEVYELEGEEPS